MRVDKKMAHGANQTNRRAFLKCALGGAVAFAVNTGIAANPALANSQYDGNPPANIRSAEAYAFDANDPDQVLTAYNRELCPVQKIENTPVKRVSFDYHPDYKIGSLVVGKNLFFIPGSESAGRTDPIGYSVMGLTKLIELPDGSRVAACTDSLKVIDLIPETPEERSQRRYAENDDALDGVMNGRYVWAKGENVGRVFSIANLVPDKVYVQGLDFIELNDITAEMVNEEMTLEQALENYGSALSKGGVCCWTDGEETYAMRLRWPDDANVYEPNCLALDSNIDPNSFSCLDGIGQIVMGFINPINPDSPDLPQYPNTWQGLNCFLNNELSLKDLDDLESMPVEYNGLSFALSRTGPERAVRIYDDLSGIEIKITEPSEGKYGGVIAQIVKKAKLEAVYSNLRMNELPKPPPILEVEGYNWWYYDITLKERDGNVGVTIQKRQKCYSFPEGEGEDICLPEKTDIADMFGTDYIPKGGEIVKKDSYHAITQGSTMTVTRTFWGVDVNENKIEVSCSVTLGPD